jgi:hypothetical protein
VGGGVVVGAWTSLSPKGNEKYRIYPALNCTVHPESSIYSQIFQLIKFLTSKAKSYSAHITPKSC